MPSALLSLITADAVIPMQGDRVLRSAGVVVERTGEDGSIVAMGTFQELMESFGGLQREHVAGLMLPGLVNAHVHLELGYQRRKIAGPVRFTEWVAGLMKNYPPADAMEATVTGAVRAGVQESLAAGVTCVGDISRHCGFTRRELTGGPLRVVSFGEVTGLGKMRGRLRSSLDAAADRALASSWLTIGLSPHAPYTVEGPSLEAIVQCAMAGGMPLAMHLAELSEERAFLEDLSGMLGREAEVTLGMDLLDAAIPLWPGGPLRWAERWGLLGEKGAAGRVPVVLAHVNYADSEEIALLAASGASVAYCPRTRGFFGHDGVCGHRYREMLAAGVNVCLGTDSLASNPDLWLLKEAQLLHQRDGLAALTAMEMITWRGAKALGLNAGRLAPGTPADIIVLPVEGSAQDGAEGILSRLLQMAPPPVGVWIGGRRMV